MSHDPLCPRNQPPNDHPWGCCCELIRAVREDERERDADGFWPPAFQDGYAAALRDAVEAVKAAPGVYGGYLFVQRSDAVAAIEALGGER